MGLPDQWFSALTRPGCVLFPENQAVLDRLPKDDLTPSPVPEGILWRAQEPPSGLKILIINTGHAILYGEHGQRILYLDPGGTPLHECAWQGDLALPRLLRARVQLDWGQWVGIKPEGLTNVAGFDLSTKPGWQKLTRKDLHDMAARAMGVSADEVALFYDEDSLKLNAHGQITIRHRKDALYVLKDGDFQQGRFMACMGAMHWGRIDFLPVVELFQSLLAGTGSAVFELIRGLYDDQNMGELPRMLRYRGIPTYPSPQAFRLFSTYFVPKVEERDESWRVRGGRVKIGDREASDPFPVFMDPARSAEVAWRPRSDPPYRLMDQDQKLCITVIAGVVHKVTNATDPTALPYTRPTPNALAGTRLVGVVKDALVLQDGAHRETIPLKQEWGILKQSSLPETPLIQPTWRDLFPEGAPHVDAVHAYLAVPLYPDNDAMVDELSTQPLAMEQILLYLERRAPPRTDPSTLIDQWDAVSVECLEVGSAQSGVILYARPEFAQRQAQRLWAQTHAFGNRPPRFKFLPIARRPQECMKIYDLIFRWISFDQYDNESTLEQTIEHIAAALGPHGFAIVAGPPRLQKPALRAGLFPEDAIPLTETPGVGMLQTILPNVRIRPDVFLYLFSRTRP
jgi:hypothetical protein